MTSVKILITYKFRHELLKSNILTPIQSGRAIADEVFDDMIGDDTGDNISKLNGKFSELSAMYWAWKNYEKLGDPEYIGFMHYRRQFIFDERLGVPYFPWISSFYYVESLDVARAYFSDESILNMVKNYDYLIPKYHVTPTKDIRDEFKIHIPGAHVEVFDTFIDICREIHPDWEEEIKKIESGNIVSVCNMFVMKKKLFFDYCEFAFPVLFELEKRIDTSGYTENGLRFVGYMAEKLQTMFTMRLEKNKNLKEKFLNCLYVCPDMRYATISKINGEFARMNHRRYKIKRWFYHLMKRISWGKAHEVYKNKYYFYKDLLS